MRKHLKHFPFFPIRTLYRHAEELFQGPPGPYSIDLRRILEWNLTNFLQGLLVHFSSTSNEHLRKKVKGIGSSSWKSIIMIHLIMNLEGIGPGNIWSMSHKFEWGSNEEMLRSWPRKLQDHIPMTFYKHLINVQDLVQGAPGALPIDF